MGGIIEALLELTAGDALPTFTGSPLDLSSLARETFAELQDSVPGRVVQLDVAPGLIANGDQRLLRVALDEPPRKRLEIHLETGRRVAFSLADSERRS